MAAARAQPDGGLADVGDLRRLVATSAAVFGTGSAVGFVVGRIRHVWFGFGLAGGVVKINKVAAALDGVRDAA